MMKLPTVVLMFLLHSCSNSNFRGQNDNNQENDQEARQKVLETLAKNGIVDAQTLNEACLKATSIKKISRSLAYNARQDCNFGVAPNLNAKDAFIQAYEISEGNISIPDGAVICNLSLQSEPNAQIHYDDFIFLAIEDQVIFGSNIEVTKRLDQKSSIYQWDWSKIAGTSIDSFEANYYCLGNQASCVLPPHDTAGPISLQLDSQDIAPLALAVAGKSQLQANLIATGDNDNEDCMHTDLNLAVEIEYIQSKN